MAFQVISGQQCWTCMSGLNEGLGACTSQKCLKEDPYAEMDFPVLLSKF